MKELEADLQPPPPKKMLRSCRSSTNSGSRVCALTGQTCSQQPEHVFGLKHNNEIKKDLPYLSSDSFQISWRPGPVILKHL